MVNERVPLRNAFKKDSPLPKFSLLNNVIIFIQNQHLVLNFVKLTQ